MYLAAVGCIRLKDSAFGASYRRLVARGMKSREALIAVMRKMLIVAYRLLQTEELYDPTTPTFAVKIGGPRGLTISMASFK